MAIRLDSDLGAHCQRFVNFFSAEKSKSQGSPEDPDNYHFDHEPLEVDRRLRKNRTSSQEAYPQTRSEYISFDTKLYHPARTSPLVPHENSMHGIAERAGHSSLNNFMGNHNNSSQKYVYGHSRSQTPDRGFIKSSNGQLHTQDNTPVSPAVEHRVSEGSNRGSGQRFTSPFNAGLPQTREFGDRGSENRQYSNRQQFFEGSNPQHDSWPYQGADPSNHTSDFHWHQAPTHQSQYQARSAGPEINPHEQLLSMHQEYIRALKTRAAAQAQELENIKKTLHEKTLSLAGLSVQFDRLEGVAKQLHAAWKKEQDRNKVLSAELDKAKEEQKRAGDALHTIETRFLEVRGVLEGLQAAKKENHALKMKNEQLEAELTHFRMQNSDLNSNLHESYRLFASLFERVVQRRDQKTEYFDESLELLLSFFEKNNAILTQTGWQEKLITIIQSGSRPTTTTTTPTRRQESGLARVTEEYSEEAYVHKLELSESQDEEEDSRARSGMRTPSPAPIPRRDDQHQQDDDADDENAQEPEDDRSNRQQNERGSERRQQLD